MLSNEISKSPTKPEMAFDKRKFILNLNCTSVLDTINTGFGSENTLYRECSTPKFTLHLGKENFLSEFSAPSEKLKVRDNLEVYSKSEIDVFVKNLTSVDLSNFITKDLVISLVADLDYVKSETLMTVKYDIPNNLFK